MPERQADRAPDGRDVALELLRVHARDLLALARRHSICADDAHDAFQRGVEILLRRAGTLEPATADRWMRTVVKHEAMAVRRERRALLGADDGALERAPSDLPGEQERVERFERLAHAAEALQRLKPQEVQALLLKAHGHSYAEIGQRMGWSYTKVNRLLTEGRRAFRHRYAAIETGAECERWAQTLSRIADGEATATELARARPHLRRCPACRATLRDFHRAPGTLAALLPAAVAAAAPEGSGALARAWAAICGEAQARGELVVAKLQVALDAPAGAKVAAVAASAAIAGGGGAALHESARVPRAHAPRPRSLAAHVPVPARSGGPAQRSRGSAPPGETPRASSTPTAGGSAPGGSETGSPRASAPPVGADFAPDAVAASQAPATGATASAGTPSSGTPPTGAPSAGAAGARSGGRLAASGGAPGAGHSAGEFEP